ncbi:MAG: peptide ABC transporter substrate-binding protein [Steroidobacteraceae bacterium]
MLKRSALWLVLSLLVACGGGAPSPDQPTGAAADAAAAERLVRGNGPEPDSLDPQRARNFESANVLRDVFEGLTAIGRDGEPVPAAAERWETSADGLRWTFTLRDALRWSNGDPVVAEDFAAALRRLVDPATASQYAQIVDVIRGANEIIQGRRPASELGVQAVDARTLVIDLATRAPYLPGLVSHWSTFPVHRATLARAGDGFMKPGVAVTNGPFLLEAWVQGSHVDLAPNPRYWNAARIRLAGVRWVTNTDSAVEYRRYRSGEIHVTAVVPPAQFDQVRAEHGAELRIGPQLGTYFFGFNLELEPFGKQPGLRRALSLVIDRQKLVETVTRVGERPGHGWVPPGTFDYTPQSLDYAARPMNERIAEAQRLYAAAGYSARRPLRFELRYNSGDVHNRIAVAVAQMWKESLGAEVSLAADEFRVLQQDIDAGRVALFRLAWIGDYNDAYSFLQYFRSDFGINTARYRSAAYDALLDAAAAAADSTVRRAKLEEAERLLLADHPILPLYFYVTKHLVNPRVVGWYDNAMNVTYSAQLALRPGR